MPYKDPNSGCEVLSVFDYLDLEAKKEGKGRSGDDLFIEVMDEIRNDQKNEETRYKTDLAYTLEEAKKAIKEWNDADPDCEQTPEPKQIIEVKEAKVNYGRGSSLKLNVIGLTEDNRKINYEISSWESGYSYWEPPDSDLEINFSYVD